MRKASISETENSLSALIDSLKSGSPVLIVDRGRPAARLEAVTVGLGDEGDGQLARLVRDGIVRPRRATPPWAVFSQEPPRAKPGASAVSALLEEVCEGR